MSHRRAVGIGLTILGVIIAAAGGIWLALNPATLAEDPTLLVIALGLFAVVFLTMLVGAFLFLSTGNQHDTEPEMELPLLVLDHLRQHGETTIAQLADALNVSPDLIRISLDELQALRLFTGYYREGDQKVGLVPRPMLELLTSCVVCAKAIDLRSSSHVICRHCGTHYYLPKI